jgi:hypothetical protein
MSSKHLVIIILKIIRLFVDSFVKPIFNFGFKLYYRKEDKQNPLPKSKNDLLYMSAMELAKKIRQREVFNSYLKKNRTTLTLLIFLQRLLVNK